MTLRSVVNRALRTRGLELKDRAAHARRYDAFLDLLRRRRFIPGTVIDVGVNRGTPWLYEAFPDSKLVLIDANPDTADTLARLREELGADIFNHAVGAEEGMATLNTDGHQPGSSSLLEVSGAVKEQWADRGVERSYTAVPVAMRTLDSTLRGAEYAAPFLIKVDTEGYEREVIRGATETLRKTDVVVAEVSVVRRFEESYEFAEFIALMDQNDFMLFDILEGKALGKGGPLSYIDAAFVRRGGSLRASSGA